ncbi:MAG: hypothetical protein IKP00_07975 [Victivallales bacterium]|nr:hypothetical protein [Victivallales bacterium]
MSDESKEETIKNQLTLAKRALSAGNYEKAEECFSKVLDCDLNHLEAIVGQASAAAHQSSLEQSRFDEMIVAVDTVKSLKDEVEPEKYQAALVQLMEQFTATMSEMTDALFSEKGSLAMQRFMNSGLLQAGRGNAAAKKMDFKSAFKKIMPELFKAEILFFNKFDEKEMLNAPICKDAYLALAKHLMGCLTNKFLIKMGGYPTIKSVAPQILEVLEKKENPKDVRFGKRFDMHRYRKALCTRLKQYYPKGTKLPGEGACYVATAVYGAYDCPEVWVLRRYRDNTLSTSLFGRSFIRLYYAISPLLVKFFGNTHWFQRFWKSQLDKMVRNLKAQGISDKPYND